MFLKKIFFCAYIIVGPLLLRAQIYSASNFTLLSVTDPETGVNSYGDKYSGCWGWYQDSTKKEYAIACAQSGTYWLDVTNPLTPTVSAYQVGVHTGSIWRETKTYKNYCYVVSDDPGTNAFQIFDMKYLPDSVHKVYESQALFSRGHNLWIDGDKLYVAAVTHNVPSSSFSNMNVYSLSNPESPVLLRSLSQDYPAINYVHDMFVRKDTIYASCASQGLYVFKYNANNTFTQLGSLVGYTFSGYNHSSALTPNGQTLVFTDEIPASMPIKIANVSNLSNIQVLATTNQFSNTTPHNPFIVSNQYCFMSSYEDGLQLYDISNPSSPFLAGYFDTYPQGGGNTNNWSNGNYEGQWGAYPYFPSKNIFALDQSNGVFLVKTNLYQNPVIPPPTNTTAIQEKTTSSFNLLFFPNPAKIKLSFNLPDNAEKELELQFYNLQGGLVLVKNGQEINANGLNGGSVEISNLPDGLYFVKLLSDNKLISTKKITITH